jgi:anti-sigma regulatory factor (Ser/Thr protein kinase)
VDAPVTHTPPSRTFQVRIDHHSAIHLAAETARRVAHQCGLPGAMPDQAAVIVSELASNLDKHAEDGTLYIQRLPLGEGLEILAADRGPGMPELERCLTDGYTTAGTLGAGLGAVSRIATHFTIRSRAGSGGDSGTYACARLKPPGSSQTASLSVGSVCLPVESEQESGDACAIVETGTSHTAIVVDGLGHGPQAAEAAQMALRSFHAGPDTPLVEMFTRMNRALRHTRGAAVSVLRLSSGRAEYCGIGNIRALTLSEHSTRHQLTGQPGVVGWSMPTPRIHAAPLAPGTTLVLHTDGIDPRWARDPSPFLLRLPPPLMSAALAHGHRHSRDDATVLTAKPPQRHS